MRPFALLVPLLVLLAGAGSAHGGPHLGLSGFSFSHRVEEGSGASPFTLSSRFAFDVANEGADVVEDVVAVVYLGSLHPSAGVQLRVLVGALEAGETRRVVAERNAIPAPYYCVELQVDGEAASDAVCAASADYSLP